MAKNIGATRTPAESDPRQTPKLGRRQKKNLLLLTILLAAASSLIVWIGTKSRPAKRPEVKVVKSDFRVAPGTLDKQSFQRQYEEKFERMDEDVRALKATIEQLNTRLNPSLGL